jgi:putative PIN family toxin of toxin-antitoxin system
VLVDTNVIVSALVFPGSVPARAMWTVVEQESLVLSDWIVDELRAVVGRKWPDRLPALESLLTAARETVVPLGTSVEIRDPGDQPILDAAITASVDVIVTGDKDFLGLALDRPAIMTPRQYLDSAQIL